MLSINTKNSYIHTCMYTHTHTHSLHMFGGPHSQSTCIAPARTQITISWLSNLD